MAKATQSLRMGTRGSLLARMQSQTAATALMAAHPGLYIQTVIITTTGDTLTQTPLHEMGGKGFFVKELQQALLDNAIDFAVHSFKDLPVTMPLVDTTDLLIAATSARQDPRDVLITPRRRTLLADLPRGAVIGTSSLRRQVQIYHHRPDLVCTPVRGNVDTRLKKLAAGDYAALVLALAGLRRCDLFHAANMTILEADELLPAAGQGALALECRRADGATREVLASLHDATTALCVQAEREVVRQLMGDCQSPIGALAVLGTDGRLQLRCAVGGRHGHGPVIFAQSAALPQSWRDAVAEAIAALVKQDVYRLLHAERGPESNGRGTQPYH